MKKRFYLKFVLFSFFFINIHLVQARKLQGTVIDSKGETLIGLTVRVKGVKTSGTVTNMDGYYQIEVSETSKFLEFSYVGFKNKDVLIPPKSNVINVTMSESSVDIGEVVVVGYGTQRKVSVTGAISSIGTKFIKQSPAPNLVSSLTGRLPGLTTMQSSGQPGSEGFDMYLRGVSTLNGSSPLILVDGVPRDNITMLDPNEIENVSILKDASATAVFGVRGANGVILITTRMGRVEKPQLSVSAEYGMQDFSTTFKKYDSWDQATMVNQAYANDGMTMPFSTTQIDKYKAQNSDYYPNTDWFNVYFKDYAPQTRYNVNLSGGTDRVKYFINLGLTQQGNVLKVQDEDVLGYDASFNLDRYNFRSNLDIKANSWIKVGVKLAGYINKVNEPNAFNSTYGNAYNTFGLVFNQKSTDAGPYVTNQMIEDYDLVPNTLMDTGKESLYGKINNQGFHRIDESNLTATTSLDFDLDWIIKGLSTNLQISFDTDNTTSIFGKIGSGWNTGYNMYVYDNKEQTNTSTGEVYDVITFNKLEDFSNHIINTDKTYAFSYKLNAQWRVNYTRNLAKKHRISLMALAQRDNKEVKKGTSMYLLPYNVLGVAGRVQYAYDDRYMAEFNIGYNGSEQFAKGKRFGIFPAGSLGWMISNEKFMENIRDISKLKLRASYGKVGSDNIGNKRFLYLDMNEVLNKGLNSNIGDGKYVKESQIGNEDLTWEVAYKQNYGIDLGMFKDKFTLGIDLFKEKREDILIGRNSIPTVLGVVTSVMPKMNLGRVDNKGYELEIGFKKRFDNGFFFSTKGTFSYAKNTIIEQDELDRGSNYASPYQREGYSIGQNFGYEIDWDSPGNGYFLSEDEIDNYAQYDGVKPRVGDFVYKDIAGAVDVDGNTIPDGIIDTKDYISIGSPDIPRVNYSFMFSASYKNFDMSSLFQGIGNSSVYYSGFGVNQALSMTFQEVHENAFNPNYIETNDNGTLYYSGGDVSYPALSTNNKNSSSVRNDFFISNRRFLRLKNFEIGYTLPSKFSKSMKIKDCRFYVNGSNLFTWTKLPFKQVDPEQKSSNSVMPIQRTISLGANIRF